MKLWEGRFKKEADKGLCDFNSSIPFDSRMYKEDITGSIAHAKMLGRQGIISESSSENIIEGLTGILADIEEGKLEIDMTAEDIHTFVESELIRRIGDDGKRLHTSRSRNDQVALDIKMHIKSSIENISGLLCRMLDTLCAIAEKNLDTVMPGYTHLQRGQPITFAHHIMAYAEMFRRDAERLADCYKRGNLMPLGACALAGTTYPIDRAYTAELLGFDGPTRNSIDSVSDRDFIIETASALSIIMMHLSRFSEEVILWCSGEFAFIELDDAFSTGSSIMPQKKNPDIPELVRGKTGRVYGNNVTLLVMMKGLPLAYNKDMQEDKEAIFDSVDSVVMCLELFPRMLETMTVKKDNMRRAAMKGFINATDCADYMTKKGMPFRSAYKLVGSMVAYCIEKDKGLEELTLEEFKAFDDIFEEDVFDAISLDRCVSTRHSLGGPAKEEVAKHIAKTKEFIKNHKVF